MLKHILKAEIGNKEIPNSLNMRVIGNFNLKKKELLQVSQWADQAQRERISLCGELEMRNRNHYENQVRTNQDIEDLRRMCYEEANQVRRLQVEELSPRQEKDPKTVSGFLESNFENYGIK